MRVVTFNISAGRSLEDGRVDAGRIADVIAGLDADVLALQEVDRDQERSGHVDLTAVAAEAMGARGVVFAPALHGTPGRRWTAATDADRPGPAYGCALLTRDPLEDVRIVRLAAAPVVLPLWVPGVGVLPVREEPRVAIVGRVRPAGAPPVTVVATHLPFTPVWKVRALRRVVAAVADVPDPVLLLGDLNLRGGAPARLTGWRSPARRPTFPAPRPRLQLDHVLLRGAATVTATSTPAVPVSDHRPLVVDLTF